MENVWLHSSWSPNSKTAYAYRLGFDKVTFLFTYLTLSLPVTHSAGDNTDLLSNSNISKILKVNIVFTQTF